MSTPIVSPPAPLSNGQTGKLPYSLDRSISFKAKGILTELLSYPPFQPVALKDLASGKDGKAAVFSGLAELERAGYLTRQRDPASGDLVYAIHGQPVSPDQRTSAKDGQS
jgi:hypothetical protein